jgi:tetratricopeptide (TPR) repeat protein
MNSRTKKFTIRHLSLCCFVGLNTFALSACDSKEERKTKYLQQGEHYVEAKNYDKARVSFKNVLQIDPNDIGGLFESGKLFIAQKDYRNAFIYLSKVIELKPDHFDANVEMARLYLMGEDLEKSAAFTDSADKIKPNDVKVLVLKSSLATRKNNISEAIELARRALAADAKSEDATVLLVNAHLQTNNTADAQTLLNTAIKDHPESTTLLSLLASLYQIKNEPENVWQTLRKIVALEPDNFERLTTVIKYLLSIKSFDKGHMLLDEYMAKHPEDKDSRLAKVELLQTEDKNDEAMALLKHYIASFPKVYDYSLYLASITLKSNRLEAIKLFSDIEQKAAGEPSEIKAKSALARIAVEDKQFDNALVKLEEILKINANDLDALELRGLIAYERGDNIVAINDLRAVLKDKPNSFHLYSVLAGAYLRNKQIELAIDLLQGGVRNFPEHVKLKLDLAKLLKKGEDIDGAIAQYQAAYKIAPDAVEVREGLVDLLLQKKDWSELNRLAQALTGAEKTQALGHYYLGLGYAGQQQHTKAIAEFDATLSQLPENTEATTARVHSLIALKQIAQARAWLKSRLEKFPENAGILNMAGELAMEEKDYGQAESYLQKAINNAPTWAIPYTRLASNYSRMEKPEKSVETLRAGIIKLPKDLILVNELTALYEKLGRIDDGIALYEQAYKDHPDQLFIANNLTMMLLTYKNSEESKKKALELSAALEKSDVPFFMDTAGWAYYKAGQLEQAQKLLEATLSKLDFQVVHYHLGMVYHAQNQLDKAKEHLAKATAGDSKYVGRQEAGTTLATLNNI